jgi:hypothetical protein
MSQVQRRSVFRICKIAPMKIGLQSGEDGNGAAGKTLPFRNPKLSRFRDKNVPLGSF